MQGLRLEHFGARTLEPALKSVVELGVPDELEAKLVNLNLPPCLLIVCEFLARSVLPVRPSPFKPPYFIKQFLIGSLRSIIKARSEQRNPRP